MPQHDTTGSPVEAALQRVASSAGGYALTVHIAASVPLDRWHAELVLPTDAGEVKPGPDTRVERCLVSVHLAPDSGVLVPPAGGPGHARVNLAVGGTQHAPTHARVYAEGGGRAGFAPITGVFTTGPDGGLLEAAEADWPGSAGIVTDPDRWEIATDSGQGSGGGGGGGGGGQTELLVEFYRDGGGTVKHVTTAGGGGGAGGGAGANPATSGGHTSGEAAEHDYSRYSKNPFDELEARIKKLEETRK